MFLPESCAVWPAAVMNYTGYGCDVGRYPAGMDLVREWAQVPYAREARYVPQLLALCKERKIQAVLPVNETELEVLDQHREVFARENIRLIMNSPVLLRNCLDKYTCMQELARLGVQVPKTTRPEDITDEHGQYILKPRSGCGSKFLKRAGSAEEVREVAAQYDGPLIVQEYLPDESEEYTMGVFSDGISTRCILFRRKLTHGYTSFVELARDEAVEGIGHRIAQAWNLRGSINIQMRRKNGKAYVFEINPRLSGTTHFRALLGFNDAYWWCETAFGRPLPDYELKYERAIGLRELNEKFILKQ